jgi:DNA mismatch repair protein MutS
VARLAGLPKTIVERARQILSALERDELARGGRPTVSGTPSNPQQQLGLFQPSEADSAKVDELRAKLAGVDVDRLTPLEALTLLAELKKEL